MTTKLTTPQRLVLLCAAHGQVIERDPHVPTGIYRSLVHPHGYLRPARGGYVITPEGRQAISSSKPISDDDFAEAAE